MQKILKLGFVGGGINSTIGQTHYIASQLDGKWKLVSGFFSRNIKININTALSMNVDKSRVYTNLNSFIEKEKDRLDAVVVLSPTPNHFLVLKKLIKKKIPVICEKPLVDNFNQIKLLKKLLIKKKSFLRVTYNYTGYPMLRALKELIKKGKLGKINQLNFEMPQDAFSKYTLSNIKPKFWRLKDKIIPNICNDLGSHLYNLSSFLTSNYPNKVMSNFFNQSKYKKLVDNAYFWLKYKNGQEASFWISKTSIGIRNGLMVRVFGQKGTAIWHQMKPEELRIYKLDGREIIFDRGNKGLLAAKKRYNRYKPGHPAGFIEAFANLYSDLAVDLKNHRKKNKKNNYTFDLEDSEKNIKFFVASSKSNLFGLWTKI
jgi:predicted dehydrogenase|tara:strand:+ start:1971 stop:3086 length:1116 start_codon:yes stop_codon:yes gene_type:complete